MLLVHKILAPNTCNPPSTRLLKVCLDVANIMEYDWVGYIMEDMKNAAKELQKKMNEGVPPSYVKGSTYFLGLYLLDWLQCNEVTPPLPSLKPRLIQWNRNQQERLETCHRVGCSPVVQYGNLKLKDVKNTCYAEDFHCPAGPLDADSVKFISDIQNELSGTDMSSEIKERIISILDAERKEIDRRREEILKEDKLRMLKLARSLCSVFTDSLRPHQETSMVVGSTEPATANNDAGNQNKGQDCRTPQVQDTEANRDISHVSSDLHTRESRDESGHTDLILNEQLNIQ
ncbi:hypothetical protein EJB05_29083, partial [Eragrostis curvula]